MTRENGRIFRRKKIPWRIIEGEAVLVDVDKGEVVHFNEVGAEIWNALDGRTSIDRIVARVQELFDVPDDDAAADTVAFIESLAELGLVEQVAVL